MLEKTKTKIVYKYMIKNSKTFQIIKHSGNFVSKYQEKREKTIDFDITERIQ